jgi:pimeloyl-ACP methyl ester carboxylesterase
MRRGFVDVDGRIVHYRRLGAGPALVLLHGSPNSSLSLAPLMTALAADFDCIALDTPGNGLSTPLLQEAPSTGDFAGALGEALDALGLTRVSLYGYHTGAGTAAAFMGRNPARVASAVLDGVAAWTREEQAEMLQGYLPPFEPHWDGSHLTWLWARVVEQSVFFPWHRQTRATRMNYDVAAPETLHEVAMQFLASGDNYRKPYAAALAGDGAARVLDLTSATLITAHPLDPIAHHLDRLGAAHPNVTVRKEKRENRDEIWLDFGRFLNAQPAPTAPTALAASSTRGFAETPRGAIHWRRAGAGRERPLLLLHEAGGSLGSFDSVFDDIAKVRPVLAVDLPGHGESEIFANCSTPEHHADAVAATLTALGVAEADVIGRHFGGAVGIELKRRRVVREAALIGAPIYSDAERRDWRGAIAPDLAIRWDGAHLAAAWRYLRFAALYDPWFLKDREHIFWGEPDLKAHSLHKRCVDLLKCGPRFAETLQAELDYPLAARMKEANVLTVFMDEADPKSAPRRLEALGMAVAGVRTIALPARDAGAILRKFCL